jgi:hypothetical protein
MATPSAECSGYRGRGGRPEGERRTSLGTRQIGRGGSPVVPRSSLERPCLGFDRRLILFFITLQALFRVEPFLARRILVIGTMMALGCWDEFSLHVRAALTEGGFSPDDIKEIILQQNAYCGAPAGNHAFKEAGAIVASMTGTG